jgi:hypothetical protein
MESEKKKRHIFFLKQKKKSETEKEEIRYKDKERGNKEERKTAIKIRLTHTIISIRANDCNFSKRGSISITIFINTTNNHIQNLKRQNAIIIIVYRNNFSS